MRSPEKARDLAQLNRMLCVRLDVKDEASSQHAIGAAGRRFYRRCSQSGSPLR